MYAVNKYDLYKTKHSKVVCIFYGKHRLLYPYDKHVNFEVENQSKVARLHWLLLFVMD